MSSAPAAESNVIRFPPPAPGRRVNTARIQPWRFAELPSNVVVNSYDKWENTDLASGDILAIALINALEKRAGLKTIGDAVLNEMARLMHTARHQRCRAINVLCDRHELRWSPMAGED